MYLLLPKMISAHTTEATQLMLYNIP